MDMPAIEFIDETRKHTGKWYEVCTFCTKDPNEKPEIIAKFVSKFEAVKFAKDYYSPAIETVIVR